MRFLRTLFLCALMLATQFAGCALVGRAFVPYYEAKETKDVNGLPPKQFPIVVVLSEGSPKPTARVVYQEDLPAFLGKHPDHSFLIPDGDADRLNVEIQKQEPAGGSAEGPYWQAYFKVAPVSPGVQRLEVFASKDDEWLNTSWYEARDRAITPQRHRYYRGPSLLFGHMHVFVLLPFAMNVALWLGLRALWRRLNASNT